MAGKFSDFTYMGSHVKFIMYDPDIKYHLGKANIVADALGWKWTVDVMALLSTQW